MTEDTPEFKKGDDVPEEKPVSEPTENLEVTIETGNRNTLPENKSLPELFGITESKAKVVIGTVLEIYKNDQDVKRVVNELQNLYPDRKEYDYACFVIGRIHGKDVARREFVPVINGAVNAVGHVAANVGANEILKIIDKLHPGLGRKLGKEIEANQNRFKEEESNSEIEEILKEPETKPAEKTSTASDDEFRMYG